jgi:hypothetical protein
VKKRILVSVLMSLGVILGSVGIGYAFSNLRAVQEGFRQGGNSQASRITIRVEAGIADPDGILVPDDGSCASTSTNFCTGGSLSFSIRNTSQIPLRVNGVFPYEIPCGAPGTPPCPIVYSNKNIDGSFAPISGATGFQSGSCKDYLSFVEPANFNNWPIIPLHSTLEVNGTDNNRLGAGLAHLKSSTPDGCQGATFSMVLIVTANDASGPLQAP